MARGALRRAAPRPASPRCTLGPMAPVRVQPLEPALAGDFLALFDRAFPDNPDWSGCYCLYYHGPNSPGESSPATAAAHRATMAERIAAGLQRGFLATADGRAVGWLNARPREGYSNPRDYVGEADAWAMCFVVDPAWRGRGVSTALLAEALAAFRAEGLRTVEAFAKPAPSADSPPDGLERDFATAAYKGPLSTYLKAGFEPVGPGAHGTIVLRATL